MYWFLYKIFYKFVLKIFLQSLFVALSIIDRYCKCIRCEYIFFFYILLFGYFLLHNFSIIFTTFLFFLNYFRKYFDSLLLIWILLYDDFWRTFIAFRDTFHVYSLCHLFFWRITLIKSTIHLKILGDLEIISLLVNNLN